jgi:putative ATP-dependent endonuclease of OLD family
VNRVIKKGLVLSAGTDRLRRRLADMRIARLKIAGFRGIETGELTFGTHSVLVGPNNVGKTTIIEALALLFGRDRLVRTLTEHDFFGGSPAERSRIMIFGTITDFPGDDPGQSRDWFSAERGVEKWLNPRDGSLSATRVSPEHKLAVQVGFSARFNVETLEAETLRFFLDDEASVGDPFDDEGLVRPVRGRTLQELGFFLVSATRTWDRWMSFSSELFRRVVATVGAVPAAAVRSERERLRQPADPLETAPGLNGIVTNVNEELRYLISNAPGLCLRVTSTDSEGVMQAVVPHFRHEEGPTLPSSRQGSGLASLQSLLLLMQFGATRVANNQCFVLAVEEPELHVQPSQQKRLVNRLSAVCSQTVMTTHSPTVASMFPPGDVIFLRNVGGVLSGTPLDGSRAVAPTNHQQHLFYGWRDRLVAALMHETVAIPEGASDVAWLEAFETAIALRQTWRADDSQPTRFGTFVGVVPTVDARIVDTFEIVRSVHGTVLCLTDGDDAGMGYVDSLRGLTVPPGVIVAWPVGWAMEDVIVWLAGAAWARSVGVLESGVGIQLPDAPALREYLLTIKSYQPHQIAVAEALAGIRECRERATALLNDLADVARGAPGTRLHLALDDERSTARTAVWRLRP